MYMQPLEVTNDIESMAQTMLGPLAKVAGCWYRRCPDGSYFRVLVLVVLREIPFHWRMYVSIIRTTSEGFHLPISEEDRDACLAFLGLKNAVPDDATDYMDCISLRYNADALKSLQARRFRGFPIQPHLHYKTGLVSAILMNFVVWAFIILCSYALVRAMM